jgi:hypothetical protein
MEKQEITLTWQGITIDVSYVPDYSDSFAKIQGWKLAHLELKRRDKGQLPMSETGYRSHFTAAANIESFGGPEGYTKAWLDEEGKSKVWQEHVSQERQLKLF